jgi:broad-specificity NMP kinase
VFAVVVTGPPGAGKTTTLVALSDALVRDEIAHAVIDVDEVAWAYPHPDDDQRLEYLRDAADAHRRQGHSLLLVGEVVVTPAAVDAVVTAVGAEDHLLVRLEAARHTLRARIVAREPPGWSSLEYLLNLADEEAVALAALDGAHLVLDTERLGPDDVAGRIRSAWPGPLAG